MSRLALAVAAICAAPAAARSACEVAAPGLAASTPIEALRSAANAAMASANEARLRFDLPATLPRLNEAIALLRQLARSGQATTADRLGLAEALTRRGGLHGFTRDFPCARPDLDGAIAIADALRASDDSIAARYHLAVAEATRGMVAANSGLVVQAAAAASKALPVLEQAAARDPRFDEGLVVGLALATDAALLRRDSKAAVEIATRGVLVARRLLDAKKNVLAKVGVAILLGARAQALVQAGNWDGAHAAMAEAVDFATATLAASPHNPDLVRLLAHVLTARGALELESGDFASAAVTNTSALSLMRDGATPGNVLGLVLLGVGHGLEGQIAVMQKKAAAAGRAFRQQLLVSRTLQAEDETPNNRLYLAGALLGIVAADSILDPPRDDTDVFAELLRLADGTQARDDPTGGLQLVMALADYYVATVRLRAGLPSSALQYADDSIARSRRFLQAYPKAPQTRSLWLALVLRGDVLQSSGDKSGAMRAYREALPLISAATGAGALHGRADRPQLEKRIADLERTMRR